MTTNAKMIVFSIVCLIASIAFLILWRRKEDHTRTDILQNVFNIPLSVITAGGLMLIDPFDDGALALWVLLWLATLIPTAICYFIFGIIIPVMKLTKKETKPTLYWINVAVLIVEMVVAPFTRI